jgi:ATP-dependent RNA helicase DeaD
VSIVTARESYRLKQIEKMINNRFHRMDIPTGKDVCRKQFFHFIDRMLEADISHGEYETYLPVLAEKFAHVSKEEILQRVAALEFDRFLQYYANAADLNIQGERVKGVGDKIKGVGDRGKESFAREGAKMQKLFINLGTKDGFYKASFLQFILDMSDLRKDVLGKIDMRDMNSYVDVDASVASKMIRALDGKKFKGRAIRMNDAETGGGRKSKK